MTGSSGDRPSTISIRPSDRRPIRIFRNSITPFSTISTCGRSEVETAADGSRGLVLVFYNRGTRHTLLGDLVLRLSQQHPIYPVIGARAELDAGMLKGVAGENILAGQRRRFRLPAPEDFGEGEIEAEFTFRPIR